MFLKINSVDLFMEYLVKLFFLATLVFVCSNCNNTPNTTLGKDVAYFDLDTFFHQEINRLRQLQVKVSKTVKIGDHQESRIQDTTLNLEQEFKLFTIHNINKPSLIGRYKVDTMQTDDSTLDTLRYLAMDKKLLTRMLMILFDNTKQVKQIEIESASGSLLINTESRAFYSPTIGYEVKSNQHLLLLGRQVFEMKASFLN